MTTPAWKLSGAEGTGDVLQDDARKRLDEAHYVKGFVVISIALNSKGHVGVIENSFSMGLSPDRVRFWRIRKDGFEGRENAEHYREHFSGKPRDDHHCSQSFEVWDIDDPLCPIGLDFVDYEQAVLNKTLGKFEDRNLRFYSRVQV